MNKKLIIILGAFLLVNTITAKSHESLDQAIMNDIRNVLNERRLLFMHPYRLKRKDDGLARIQGKHDMSTYSIGAINKLLMYSQTPRRIIYFRTRSFSRYRR